MSTIDFKLAIILGSKLEEVRGGIEQLESMHLGLFINSLRYKDKKEGKKLKQDFINSIGNGIRVVNKEISKFNALIRYLNDGAFGLSPVNKIDYASIKKIILEHKGDYPQSESTGSFIQEALGEGDSPSVLARQHTSLLIRNVILKTKLSLSDFVKSLNRFLEVFNSIDQRVLRQHIQNEIEKARTAYSVGLFGESIFIIGRILENLSTEYIFLLKRKKKINLSREQILNFDFHKKIEFLHSNKKTQIFSDSQFSKIISVKWDRNVYGHKIGTHPKDHNAMVMIGLMAVSFMDKRIQKNEIV